uniref:JNK pathway associated phosphatase n=1 Tax=Mus spicilegus TaxID=10103 RepID=A0A8C6HW59_MUSSI
MPMSLFQILPGLYIGNFKDARDAEQLSRNKVTHILSVHDTARPMLEGVKYLCIPAADTPSQNLTRHFKESIKFIHECRLQGESCLVHCLAGVSRSVTLVIAYIMTVTDFGWEDALHTVRAGRSCANPNLGFQRQLQEFEKHEVHQVSSLWENLSGVDSHTGPCFHFKNCGTWNWKAHTSPWAQDSPLHTSKSPASFVLLHCSHGSWALLFGCTWYSISACFSL